MTTATKTLWNIDQSHSEIQFKVKHLVISTVTGSFGSFDASVETEGEGFEGASVQFEVEIDSISTNNEDRDKHLKSDDFFNAEAYPRLTFNSTGMEKVEDNTYSLTGELAIRGKTKTVDLKAIHGGTVEDPYGQTKAGFEITGTINRKDFGLEWSAVTEAGNVVVGDNVQLQLNVQLVKETG